ncbi:type II toxin-antitoxin system VapB family antitoxin [Kribbella sp. C-35]|uniref:type II toxin-antitoxin system VapB family antitoxin n=1 Tax=Kribbella sp. C-35 TaxID=2789276 RepID=UPI00397B963B
MARIDLDVNDEWLAAARAELGTSGDEETINAALSQFVRWRRAQRLIETLNAVEMDFTGSADAWRYGGGRDLSRLAENARDGAATSDIEGGTDSLRG